MSPIKKRKRLKDSPERRALILLLRYGGVTKRPGKDDGDGLDWHGWADSLSGMSFFEDVHAPIVKAALERVAPAPEIQESSEHIAVMPFVAHVNECEQCERDPRGLCVTGRALGVAIPFKAAK